MSLPDMVDHQQIKLRRGGECIACLRGLAAPVGVEVGVYRGALAACVLRELPTLTWHMVDPWCSPAPSSRYHASGDSVSMLTEQQFAQVHADCLQRVAFAGNRAVIHVGSSLEKAALFDDASVDLVFIDASHDLDDVADDVAAWAPKVRPGGWIGGHDWKPDKARKKGWDVEPGVRNGLRRAGLAAMTVQPGRDKTWWLKLPGGGA